jgi:hypothetical protein
VRQIACNPNLQLGRKALRRIQTRLVFQSVSTVTVFLSQLRRRAWLYLFRKLLQALHSCAILDVLFHLRQFLYAGAAVHHGGQLGKVSVGCRGVLLRRPRARRLSGLVGLAGIGLDGLFHRVRSPSSKMTRTVLNSRHRDTRTP